MIIAAHCLNYPKQQSYLLQAMLALAAQQPQNNFLIFSETKIDFPKNLKNIACYSMQPAIKNKLSLQYWYLFKMPLILKNKKVSIFISEAGMLCKNLNIPQYLFLSPENKQANLKPLNLAYQYPNLFAKQVNNAKAVFITEPFLTEVVKNKKTPCYPVYHGLPKNYQSYNFEEKEIWINDNREGYEYFVFHVSATTKAQLLPMLKAFSIFKKWTESSLKLVLLLHIPFAEKDIPKFNLYKFRKEVSFVNFIDDAMAAPLYACAFLHIYLPGNLADENFPLHALQTKSTLLTVDTEAQKMRFGSGAAYCSLQEKYIAEKLLYYYKNDFEKENLAVQVETILKNYSLQNSAAQMAYYLNL